MKDAVIIEVITKLKDQSGSGLSNVEKNIEKVSNAAKKGEKVLDNMGKSAKTSASEAGTAMKSIGTFAKQTEKGMAGAEAGGH